jgi:hypothetical protein
MANDNNDDDFHPVGTPTTRMFQHLHSREGANGGGIGAAIGAAAGGALGAATGGLGGALAEAVLTPIAAAAGHKVAQFVGLEKDEDD